MSNRGMSIQNQTLEADQRLTNLEIKATYTEDLLEQLDAVIVRQQKQIDQLVGEVQRLRESFTLGESVSSEAKFLDLHGDLPPHF